MKIRFKPANSEKEVFLFANRVEAIVFWLCITGLLLFLITTLFRYYYLKPMVQEFNEGVKNVVPTIEMEKRIDSLEVERDFLQVRVQTLLDSTESLKRDIANLRSLHAPPPPRKIEVIRLP